MVEFVYAVEFVSAEELVRRRVNNGFHDECFGDALEVGEFYAVIRGNESTGLSDLIAYLEDGECVDAENAKALVYSCGAIYRINNCGVWHVNLFDINRKKEFEEAIEELQRWQEEVYALEDGE